MSINILAIIREIENSLYSPDFRKWFNSLPADQNKAIGALRDEITHYRLNLENEELKLLVGKLDKLANSFEAATVELQDAIDKMDSSIKTIELLGNIIGLIARVVTVAAAPSAAPLALGREPIEARSALRSRVMMFREEPATTLPESSIVDNSVVDNIVEKSVALERSFLLIEEVLYGVELTEDELIITVATKGVDCTKREDFRFDVNRGSNKGKEWNEGQPPYIVTVYRVDPDTCYKAPGLITLSYSRKELGLDGTVEFILRNRIGNTSNHRLPG